MARLVQLHTEHLNLQRPAEKLWLALEGCVGGTFA